MRTFKGTLTQDFKVVVHEDFIKDMREAAQQEDASAFLKAIQAKHPLNDDAFCEAVISNGLRIASRDALARQIDSPVTGGTVSPARVSIISCIPEHDADANPQVLVKSATPIADALATAPYPEHGGW